MKHLLVVYAYCISCAQKQAAPQSDLAEEGSCINPILCDLYKDHLHLQVN